jgi:hypothetical protein
MWSTRKFIIALSIAALLAIASVGVVLAQDNGEDAPAAKSGELLERVCEIYQDNTGDNIDPEALKEAIAQARSEVQAAAMEARLARMVENGVINEAQAEEFQEWWESRPEGLPFGLGFGGHCIQRGFGGPGFGPPPLPE